MTDEEAAYDQEAYDVILQRNPVWEAYKKKIAEKEKEEEDD